MMRTIFENSLVFNRGIKRLGLKVARVWSRTGWWTGFFRGLKELNPYQFGDLPTSWAWSFQASLKVAYSERDIFRLPGYESITPGKFVVFEDGQNGTVFFGRDVAFFIHYIYGEVDPSLGSFLPPCIAFPSNVYREFLEFIIDNDKKNITKAECRSTSFPEIAISTDIVNGYLEIRVNSTLHEFKLCEDGIVEPVPSTERNSVAYGEIAIPEALTIDVVVRALEQMSRAELEAVLAQATSDEMPPAEYSEIAPTCGGMMLLCNETISFLMPPDFLRSIAEGDCAVLPPVAVPVDKLTNILQEILHEKQKHS